MAQFANHEASIRFRVKVSRFCSWGASLTRSLLKISAPFLRVDFLMSQVPMLRAPCWSLGGGCFLTARYQCSPPPPPPQGSRSVTGQTLSFDKILSFCWLELPPLRQSSWVRKASAEPRWSNSFFLSFYGTYRAVKARFWPLISGISPLNLRRCSLFTIC